MVPLGEVALSTRIEGAGTERNPRRCVPLLGVRVPLRRTTYQIFHMRLPWDKWSFCLTTARMAGDQERYCVQRQAFYDVSICTTPTCIDSERARFVNGLLILLCHRLLRNAIFPKEINRLVTGAQKY